MELCSWLHFNLVSLGISVGSFANVVVSDPRTQTLHLYGKSLADFRRRHTMTALLERISRHLRAVYCLLSILMLLSVRRLLTGQFLELLFHKLLRLYIDGVYLFFVMCPLYLGRWQL